MDKSKNIANPGETPEKAQPTTSSKNRQKSATTSAEKNGVVQNGRSTVNTAAKTSAAKSTPRSTTAFTGASAVSKPSSIESNSRRKKAPHTVSTPPADVGNRLDKFESLLEEQAKNNQRFQSMIMHAMMPADESEYVGYDDDTPSFCSDRDYMQHDPELDDALAFMVRNEQGEGEADAPPADVHNAPLAADNENNDGQAAQAAAVENNADERQNMPPGFAARFAAQPDTGPPIDEAVAGSLNFLIHNSIEDSTLSELYDRYNCPSNANNMIVQRVNPTIWESIPSKARSQDLKLQRVQKPLVKGITALTRAIQNTELGTQHQDALALLANATFELICLRKEMLKPVLNTKYAHLCKPSVKPTDLLFGDVGKMVKELDEAHKASAGILAFRYGNRFNPTMIRNMRRGNRYNPYSNMGRRGALPFARGQNPFLGYGRGASNFRGMRRAQSYQNLNYAPRQHKRVQQGNQTQTKQNQK